MNKEELLPCPWCGKPPRCNEYDRLVSIGCDDCGYSIGYESLLQTKPNDKPIPYADKDGNIIPPEEVRIQEYYYYDAIDKAHKKWNTRKGGSDE